MSTHDRRDVLKCAGLTMVAGGLLATTTTSAAGRRGEPATTADSGGWSSLDGNPGNNPYRPDERGPDDSAAVDWEYERGGPIAVVDDTVLVTTDGEVHAVAAADGSLEWRTDDVGARAPRRNRLRQRRQPARDSLGGRRLERRCG